MWRVKSQFDRLQVNAIEDSDFYYQFKHITENSKINKGTCYGKRAEKEAM